MNKFFDFLISIPVIVIAFYFVPLLGVILLLIKLFTIQHKWYKVNISLIVLGGLLILPNIINNFIDLSFVKSFIYESFFDLGKNLVIYNIIVFIVFFLLKKLIDKIKNSVNRLLKIKMEEDRVINEKNNLKIKEKQFRAKMTQVVECPNCGASVLLTNSTGVCNYCRTSLNIDPNKVIK